ncbi:hypothetical protein EOE67_10840 [Rheinheimera riviphila]|uniref:Uncharacterized protein n=1 Tax=Rheinheimera riviphila TaxID=1834037 RepID=A0A437QSC4_9GAMM|nr:hypothetical protein [Rheinheimera riviphila]RVU37369.1 hypothetical protein EOE67_10840 [Rheinheimera riviphila]
MNSHQQQLLQLLQIKPVQLHADFSRFQPQHQRIDVHELPNATSVEMPAAEPIQLSNQIPVEFTSFAADIQQALQLCQPQFRWCWSAQLPQSELNGTEIHTPELAALTAPALKQQLWQLMAQYLSPQQADQDEPN